MLTITERHQEILNLIKENEQVFIEDLSKKFKVSGVTIRKDLKLLEEKGLLFRTKGGASTKNTYALEKSIHEKELINADIKKAIAIAAFQLTKDHESIIIGSGTTVFQLAKVLKPEKPLTIITPALKVALELTDTPNLDVLQLGGQIRPNSSSVAGTFAEYILDNLSAGIAFIGIDGIDPVFGASISNLAEAGLNQKIIAIAQKVVILADHTKFGKRGIAKICDLKHIDYVITDNKSSKKIISELEEHGIQVIIA